MKCTITMSPEATDPTRFSWDRWFDPVEEAVRARVRGFIEELLETEPDGVLHGSPYASKTPRCRRHPSATAMAIARGCWSARSGLSRSMSRGPGPSTPSSVCTKRAGG